jgi:hypothetical protein
MKLCSVEGCVKPHLAKGYCNGHYRRYRLGLDDMTLRTSRGVPLKWIESHKDWKSDDCLLWPFLANTNGYGQVSLNGKRKIVARMMCEHRHGPPPSPKHQTAHTCGKGHLACVNPEHVIWATPRENNSHKWAHGTMNVGTKNGAAKLTPEDVAAIRASRLSLSKCSRLFGISIATASRIRSKQLWAHV